MLSHGWYDFDPLSPPPAFPPKDGLERQQECLRQKRAIHLMAQGRKQILVFHAKLRGLQSLFPQAIQVGGQMLFVMFDKDYHGKEST